MIFSNFDFSLLKSPEFKEDSVREELICPLLKKLGYSASGENRIIRSKALTHPFVYLGSKKHQVKIIPDYVLEVQGATRWILDAKAPWEKIHNGKNTEQAFSYAIHPDIRASIYVLCNGYSLVAYHISKYAPILDVKLKDINCQWKEIETALSPKAFTNLDALHFKPDYGLYSLKLGASSSVSQYFYGIGLPFICRVRDDLYTASLNIKCGDDFYCLSLDFEPAVYRQLLKVINQEHAQSIEQSLSMQPYKIDMEDNCPIVNVTARLGDNVITNNDESYLPLIVEHFDADQCK